MREVRLHQEAKARPAAVHPQCAQCVRLTQADLARTICTLHSGDSYSRVKAPPLTCRQAAKKGGHSPVRRLAPGALGPRDLIVRDPGRARLTPAQLAVSASQFDIQTRPMHALDGQWHGLEPAHQDFTYARAQCMPSACSVHGMESAPQEIQAKRLGDCAARE